MKPPFRLLLNLGLLTAATAGGFAQGMNTLYPERMVASVDALVSLTATQKAKVTEIVNRAAAEVGAMSSAKRLADNGTVSSKMRSEIRALLTPEQGSKYDRTPQPNGGGLMLATPDRKVGRLDQLVTLTAAQKAQALQIFTAEFEALLAIPNAERMEKGTAVRTTAREAARSILTPSQQALYDATPPGKGGGSITGGRS